MPRTAAPGRLVDVGGHRLHLLCAGAGAPAVVFDAALGASSISWSLVQPEVARVTRACAYDRAGFGWSDAGPKPRTAGRIAAELRELLVRAAVPPPYVLVGHSFGGLVVRVFASRHPRDVAGLVLVDPAHPEEWIEPGEHERRQIARGVALCRYGARAARLGVARVVAGLVALGALAPARALTRLVSRGGLGRADEEILAPVRKLPREARRPLSEFWTEPRFFEALGSQIESIGQSAAEARDAALPRVPVVAVSSGSSSPGRLALQEALAARTGGRHVVARHSGHWVPLDEPDVVVRAIVELVEQARRPDL
jgi:pimeloyl-ACP methyl ester carboxylesterase